MRNRLSPLNSRLFRWLDLPPAVPALMLLALAALASSLVAGPAFAESTQAEPGQWAQWRGPDGTGVSPQTGLIDSWSLEGENLIWRADFTGRSTPVVFDGRVCANGRRGTDVERQAVAACWDAGTGELLWERRFNIFLTTVPFNRVGWGNPAGDPETGYLYVHTVDGKLMALDRDGETVWSWRLGEDVGRFSGYGGRTHTPLIDGDQLILSVINSNWGDQGAPRHRYFSFDKLTGEVQWVSTPGGGPADLNTHSTPVLTEIDGQRLIIGGNADGGIYAVKAGTGEKVWGFDLSKRGINASVVVDGSRVYAAHSEENVDEGTMGRVVAIDGTGSGDITGSHELWRADIGAGYASPTLHQGVLYVADNSANIHALNAADGKPLWESNYGNVGKGSPVWADGKLYVTEVNGNFVILEVGPDGATKLDDEHIEMPTGRYAEIYSSPAIAYDRIYFATENGIFALGNKEAPFEAEDAPAPPKPAKAPADAAAAVLQVVPAELILRPGESQDFTARVFDAKGRLIKEVDAQWSLAGLQGKVADDGTFQPDAAAGSQAGKVQATFGGLTGSARVRIGADLPLAENFDSLEPGGKRAYWIGSGKFEVVERDGETMLMKPPSSRGIHRHHMLIGRSDLDNYTIQTDAMGTQEGRRRPDVGLINSGYTMDLQGNHQRLVLRTWDAELRVEERTDFAWDMDTWYTLKMQVAQEADKAVIRGKVWKKGEPEPEEWTLTAEDPLPVTSGSPGLFGYSPVNLFFDNVTVVENP